MDEFKHFDKSYRQSGHKNWYKIFFTKKKEFEF